MRSAGSSARAMSSKIGSRSSPGARTLSLPTIQRSASIGSCACGGSCPRCQKKSALPISQPGDALEREADRVADHVMGTSLQTADRPSLHSSTPTLLRSATSDAVAPHTATLVNDTLHSAGQPLESATRSFFEPRLGHDLSNVRVHTDVQSAQSARAMNAIAYTVGSHIAFDAGRYAPTTNTGRRLLAHELAHVIQQSNGTTAPAIQRQTAGAQSGGAPQATAGAVQAAGTVPEYLAVICEVIADIRVAVEEGRVWPFEDEVRLAGDQMTGNAGLSAGQRPLNEHRLLLLRSIAESLDALGQQIESGAQPLTLPANRLNVARMWHGSRPRREIISIDRVPPGHISRWTDRQGFERESPTSTRTRPVYPSPAYYIARASDTTSRILQPHPFPTWWHESCGPREQTVVPGGANNATGRTLATCSAQGGVTSRQIVWPRPPRSPYVLRGGGGRFEDDDVFGNVYEERRDASGALFICLPTGGRVDQSW